MTTLTLKVPNISCGHCKTSIEGAVAPPSPGSSPSKCTSNRGRRHHMG